MKQFDGFSLIEALLTSLLTSVLVAAAVGFINTQLKTTQALHRQFQAQAYFEQGFSRMSKSLRRLELPIGSGHIELLSNGVALEYRGGDHTENCLGTQVLPGSIVLERFVLVQDNLRCEAQYIDLKGVSKTDHQPVLGQVADFSVELQRLQTTDCVDAVDLFLSHRLGDTLQQQSQRLVFNVCVVGDSYASQL